MLNKNDGMLTAHQNSITPEKAPACVARFPILDLDPFTGRMRLQETEAKHLTPFINNGF